MSALIRSIALIACVSCLTSASLAAAQEDLAPSEEPTLPSETSESGAPSGAETPTREVPEAQGFEAKPVAPAVISETPTTTLAAPKPEAELETTTTQYPLLPLFLALVAIAVALFLVERVRNWISVNVPLRRFLGVLSFALRLSGIAVIIGVVLRLLPEGQDWILWGLAVLVIVTGWSVRDLFADIVAGAVLAAERRVRKGMWVSGNGFQGTVEGRSLRATWLRDGQGHRLTVPNRAMVAAPMVYDSGAEAEHEVAVRLEGYDDASRVRSALHDAILSSPWVLAGASPVVLRDPSDPVLWRVRSKLLEPRFSVHFEGELLERVEDLLRHSPPAESSRDTMVDEVTEEDDVS